MLPRYTLPVFEKLWSDQHRLKTWLDVELLHCEAMEMERVVPHETSEKVRRAMPEILDEARVAELEAVTRHDVLAFLAYVEETAGEPARWLHHGLTSSDLVDTALARTLGQVSDVLLASADALVRELGIKAIVYDETPMMGRSHGMHAEPVTFGLVMASHLAEVGRCRERLRAARADIMTGKMSGAVGTYWNASSVSERWALSRLGLVADDVSTQVVARDRHAAFVSALALMAAAVERLAVNVRHWQRTEVSEAAEPFSRGQKGSSAMPHKRNPVASENLCGLARVVRAAVVPALEDVALWHERDISHSSVERHLLPDSTSVLGYMLEKAASLVAGLEVNPERMRTNLEYNGRIFFSESVMLALVKKGLGRREAHDMVQRCVADGQAHGRPFFSYVHDNAEIRALLSNDELRALTDFHGCIGEAKKVVARVVDRYR